MSDKEKKVSLRETISLYIRMLRLLYRKSPKMVLSVILSTVWNAGFVYIPVWFSARIITALTEDAPVPEIRTLVILTLFVTALGTFISIALKRFMSVYYDEGTYVETIRIWQEKLLSADFVVADDPKTQALLSELRQYTNGGGYGFIRSMDGFVKMLRSLVTMLGGVILTVSLFTAKVSESSPLRFLNHPLFAAAVILLFAAFAFVSQSITVWAENYWYENADEHSAGNRLFGHFLYLALYSHADADLRLYQQVAFSDRFASDKTGTFSSQGPFAVKARGKVGISLAVASALSVLLTGLIAAFVGLKALGGAFGVGLVTQYIAAAVKLFAGLAESGGIIGESRANAWFLKKNFEFLDLPDPMYQGSLTIEKRRDRNYEIEFRNVSFRYPGSDTYALRNVNYSFRIGRRLAIVGENGSGKTTFIKLLARLYDPTEGEILLNGIDIRKYDYREYLSVFSVVFQDFCLPAFRLGEAVASGSDYDRKRAEDALSRAGFSERLSELPDGLDSFITKDYDASGVDFSGGESQKIAIARAIYKDAPFMILDEPTAALDPVAEAEVYSKFDEIAEDRTTVFISHRLSSCRFCDEIAVFSDGSIIQNGTHESLLSDAGGKYAQLWNAQAQWYA